MSTFKKYVYRPREVYAIQWRGDNIEEINEFLHDLWDSDVNAEKLFDSSALNFFKGSTPVLELMRRGQWLIKEYWSADIGICDREYFDSTFEEKP